MLYQNDGFGKDYLIGLKDVLGADHAGMIVKEASYETSEPTVNSQIVTLQGSGADLLLIGATPKFAAQAIRKSFNLGWTRPAISPTSRHRSRRSSNQPASTSRKASSPAVYVKDPTDAR